MKLLLFCAVVASDCCMVSIADIPGKFLFISETSRVLKYDFLLFCVLVVLWPASATSCRFDLELCELFGC